MLIGNNKLVVGKNPGRRNDNLPPDPPTREEQIDVRQLTSQILDAQALRDSEARLRGVVDHAIDGIITMSELGVIESINEAGIQAFGYSRDELLGQNIRVLMAEPDFIEHVIDLAHIRRAGELKIIGICREVIGRRKEGNIFPVELSISEVQLADRRLFTGIVRDITRRKQTQQSLVNAKEAAEAANRAKEHFLSVLSHELRTPLTPVLAELSFIEEDANLPAEIRNRLKMVRRNIGIAAHLVDDLLDISKIAQGKIHLKYEAVDLHESVRAALDMFQAASDVKKLHISVDLRAKEHHAWADPVRIQQILLNLLSNAVKFTPVNGRISIRSSNDPAGLFQIEFCDSGLGMDSDMLTRLFTAFEQSDRTRRLGGLGLGLSIARYLAQMHEGKLTASSPGCDLGATFRFALATVAPVAEMPPGLASTPAAKFRIDRRILLVEDHEDTRTVMTRLLNSLGYRVTATATMREAIEASEAGTFDLLISDIGLPDGSGLELLQHLKTRIERRIVLSGYGQEEDQRLSREAGFELHLTKPVDFKMLKDVLQQVGQ